MIGIIKKVKYKKTLVITTAVLITAVGSYAATTLNQRQKDSMDSTPAIQENPFKDFKISSRVYPVTYTDLQAGEVTVVVNKKHALPATYAPVIKEWNGVSLREDALEQYKKLIAGAKNNGITLRGISSYRSYADQEELFGSYVKKDSQMKAETYRARPGYSEHQTGLAVDIGLPSGACNLEVCMADTIEGRWLSSNSHVYGFIIRYPEGKEGETGYQFEPWHIRYVGPGVAANIYESGYTLDAYLGITAGDYIPQATTNL